MTSVTITSGIDGIVREIKFPNFRNVFLMSTMSVEGTHFRKFIIMDRSSYVVLFTGLTYSQMIYRLSDLLSDMNQADLDEFIRTIAE